MIATHAQAGILRLVDPEDPGLGLVVLSPKETATETALPATETEPEFGLAEYPAGESIENEYVPFASRN